MKFIGKSSCGFQHGKIYKLSEIFIPNGNSVLIKLIAVNEKGWTACPYCSVAAIMRNWKYVGE